MLSMTQLLKGLTTYSTKQGNTGSPCLRFYISLPPPSQTSPREPLNGSPDPFAGKLIPWLALQTYWMTRHCDRRQTLQTS